MIGIYEKLPMKKQEIKSNIVKGYDEKGNLIMYYWQKDSNSYRFRIVCAGRRWGKSVLKWWWSKKIICKVGEK